MKNNNNFKILEKLSEIWGAIIIMFSFVMIAIIIGYLLHYYVNPILGIAVGIIIIVFGGIIVIKSYKGKGTFIILSKTIASDDINSKERKEN
jgi:cytochrome c biogenesis protein CcdA